MCKQLWIDAHEQLIEEYLEAHPEATDAEAEEATVDFAEERCGDNMGAAIDAARSAYSLWPKNIAREWDTNHKVHRGPQVED